MVEIALNFTNAIYAVSALFILYGLYYLIREKLVLRVANEAPYIHSYIPLLNSAFHFGAGPYEFLHKCRSKYGEIFTVRLAGKRTTFVADPLSYNSIFRNKNLTFGLISDEISLHVLNQRPAAIGHEDIDVEVHRQFTSLLQGKGLDELTSSTYTAIHHYFHKDKARMRKNGSTAAERGLNDLCFDIIFITAVESAFGDLPNPELKPLFQRFDAAFPMLVAQLPQFILKNGIAAREQLIKILGTTEPRPNESSIIRARAELFAANPDKFDLHDVGSLQTAMLWAAVANTAPATFWTMFYLLTNAQALQSIQEEINQYLPPPNTSSSEPNLAEIWTREQLNSCVLLDSAINEALRLTTGSMVMRKATQNTTIPMQDGRIIGIRRGDCVAIYPQLSHYDQRLFPNPLSYEYDRFLPNNLNKTDKLNGSKVANAFLPFGAGSSQCPGRFWAKNEIKIFVAQLLYSLNIEFVEENVAAPKVDISRVGLGVYGPEKDVRVKYSYKH
jgi:cholesterol 7alpha-monooxygenase